MNDNILNLPIYELIFQECDDIGIALVDYPAIEKDFMYFNKEDIKMIFNDEKMMIKGPALIPNKLIYRNDALGERYVYFSEDTIIQFVENLMAKDKNKFNLSHSEEYVDLTIIESYFTTETNEFDVPKGSWIVGAKVKDRDVWDKIKDGKFKGYSIQSLFSNELVSFVANSNNNKINNKKSMSKLKNQISDALNKVLFPNEFEEIKEVSVWSVEVANTSFEIGETIMYEYDGEQYPVSAGEFRLKDGTKIVTDASGVIVSKEDAPKDADPVEEAPKEEVKKEEFEETPVEEEVKEEEVEEIVEKTIDEKLADLKAEILEEVKTMIEDSGKEVADAVEEFGKKVVEFGKQPIEQKTVKEEVAVPKLFNKNNKATQFFAQ